MDCLLTGGRSRSPAQCAALATIMRLDYKYFCRKLISGIVGWYLVGLLPRFRIDLLAYIFLSFFV